MKNYYSLSIVTLLLMAALVFAPAFGCATNSTGGAGDGCKAAKASCHASGTTCCKDGKCACGSDCKCPCCKEGKCACCKESKCTAACGVKK